MSYDYDKTSVDLYRAVFKSNFETDVGRYLKPDRELADSESIAPILHPLSPNRLASRSPGRPISLPTSRPECSSPIAGEHRYSIVRAFFGERMGTSSSLPAPTFRPT
jgi:hypothetical protein